MTGAIIECELTGKHSDYPARNRYTQQEWELHRGNLLSAPPSAIAVKDGSAPFEIEINVTDANDIQLVFRKAARKITQKAEILFVKQINRDEHAEFFKAAFSCRDIAAQYVEARQNRTPTKAERLQNRLKVSGVSGIAMLVKLLRPEINLRSDYARDLFFLCAHAVRPGPARHHPEIISRSQNHA